MFLAGWAAVGVLVLAALAMTARNFVMVARAERIVLKLASDIGAKVNKEDKKDRLNWRKGETAFEINLRRTALAKVNQFSLQVHDDNRRPVYRAVRLATKRENGGESWGPHALGFKNFDQIGRIIGIGNSGVREHLRDNKRPEKLTKLLEIGFDEVEVQRGSIFAKRTGPFDPDVLETRNIQSWIGMLQEL